MPTASENPPGKRKRNDEKEIEDPDSGDDEVSTALSTSINKLPTTPHPAVAKLLPLDFNSLPENFFTIFYGVRRTGKTHAVSCLLEQVKDRFDFAYLFSETAHLHRGQKGELDFDMIRPEAKFDGFDEEALQRIFDRQKTVMLHNNSCKNEIDKKPNKTLVIFDDFVHDKRIRYSELFTRLPVLGRHYEISVVCLTQGYSQVAAGGLNKATRQNADFVATFLPRNANDLERISEWYLTQHKFENMWFTKSVCQEEHSMLGIDLSKPHLTEFHQFCHKYVAPADVPTYELGKVQWHIFREEEKRKKIAAKAEEAKKSAPVIYQEEELLEWQAKANECTGLPEHKPRTTLFDAMLLKGISFN